jgi:hypothetical protein
MYGNGFYLNFLRFGTQRYLGPGLLESPQDHYPLRFC